MSCFYSPPDGYSWDAGRSECQSLGGDMAMLKTAEKQQEAKEYLDKLWTKCIIPCYGKRPPENKCQMCLTRV